MLKIRCNIKVRHSLKSVKIEIQILFRESRSEVKRRDRNPRYSPSSQNNRYSVNFNLASINSITIGLQVNSNHWL